MAKKVGTKLVPRFNVDLKVQGSDGAIIADNSGDLWFIKPNLGTARRVKFEERR